MALKVKFRTQLAANIKVTSPVLLTKTGSDLIIGFDTATAVLQGATGATGAKGDTGAAGAGYGGTSATSLAIANSVTKVFATQAGLAYQVGNYVRASSAAGSGNFMEGTVSAYSGTSLSIAVTTIGGSGTKADWVFAISGVPGTTGVSSINGNNGAFTSSNGVKNVVNDLQIDTSFLQGYISGLTLSNDGVTPNSILDIAAGVCTDSTNAAFIKLAAFTKSTAGSWAAGTAGNGMGGGLTIANSTWYHVFAIINAGAADVYFDTSITAANKPASTTAFRRIGSFKTDGSAHILGFVQLGNEFMWKASVLDVSGSGMSITAGNATLTVPPNVVVKARIIARNNAGVATVRLWIYNPQMTDEAASATEALSVLSSTTAILTPIDVWTDTSRNVRVVADVASGTYDIRTFGWVDLL